MRLLHLLFTLIKSPYSSFIKNNDLPVCINCIHFIEYKNSFDNDSFGRCKIFGRKNVVTGFIDNDYAEQCRKDKEKCDIHGKYFEEKNGKNESK